MVLENLNLSIHGQGGPNPVKFAGWENVASPSRHPALRVPAADLTGAVGQV